MTNSPNSLWDDKLLNDERTICMDSNFTMNLGRVYFCPIIYDNLDIVRRMCGVRELLGE